MADRGADLAAVGRRVELTVLACHIPVKVTVVGRPAGTVLRGLADRVEAAVGGRLVEAARTLPAGKAVMHPPVAVQFSGDLVDADRTELDDLLRSAVRRAIRGTGAVAAPPVLAGAPRVGLGGGPGDPAQGLWAAGQGPRWVAVSPSGDVREGASPFDGIPVAALPGMRPVLLHSARHAIAGTLTLALQLGMVLFPAGSFVILEGPEGTFWAVGTEPAVDAAELAAVGSLAGDLPVADTPTGGSTHRVRGLITRDRRPVWENGAAGVDWLRQLAAEAAAGVPPLLPDQLTAAVVAGADQLVDWVASGRAGTPLPVGTRSTLVDRQAFSLVPWEIKSGYLRALLAATPWGEQRHTALEILASLSSGAEIDAVVAVLRETGLQGRLFDDPDGEVYDLFAKVGERFPREPGRLTAHAVANLLRDFDLLPSRLHDEALVARMTDPRHTVVPEEMLDLARESATGFVLAGQAIGESVSALFTSPQLVARAVESLTQLLVTVRLATAGYRPSVWQLDRFLEHLPTAVAAAARGAERLDAGDRTLSRLRWREVWDIASRFGDTGAVTTADEPGEVSGDATAVLHFLDTLVRLGEPVDAGTLTARLVTLAGALAVARRDLGGAEAITALLACLPDDQTLRLGRLLAATRIVPGTSLDELAGSHPDLHLAATDALATIAVLRTFAVGGLDAPIVAAFHTLLVTDGVGLAGAAVVGAALQTGEGARFATAVGHVLMPRVDPAVRTEFLASLAGSTRRMDSLIDYGFDAYAAVYLQAAGERARLDRHLDALAGRASSLGTVEFRRLLDGIAANDPVAWMSMEDAD